MRISRTLASLVVMRETTRRLFVRLALLWMLYLLDLYFNLFAHYFTSFAVDVVVDDAAIAIVCVVIRVLLKNIGVWNEILVAFNFFFLLASLATQQSLSTSTKPMTTMTEPINVCTRWVNECVSCIEPANTKRHRINVYKQLYCNQIPLVVCVVRARVVSHFSCMFGFVPLFGWLRDFRRFYFFSVFRFVDTILHESGDDGVVRDSRWIPFALLRFLWLGREVCVNVTDTGLFCLVSETIS